MHLFDFSGGTGVFMSLCPAKTLAGGHACYILPKFGRLVYYMFVDESGSPLIPRVGARSGDIFLQCGLIVHAANVHEARAAVDRAKRELFGDKDPMKWELHAYEIWRGRGRFSKDLRITDTDEKLKVFARSVRAIQESKAVLVSVIIRKDRLTSGHRDLLKLSWMMITERFEQYLANHGDGEHGVIIADASGRGTESKIANLMLDMSIGMGRRRGRPTLVSTDVDFVNSLDEPLVQAADMAAYITHKSYRGYALFKGLFDALVPCMWQHNGKLEGFGIKHYPDRG